MSRKPVRDPQFHDASDPRCTLHTLSGEPARLERRCPKCRPLRKRRAVRP